MTNRFYYPSITERTKSIREKGVIHQLLNVLRKKPKDKIVLFAGSGKEYLFRISQISKKEIKGEVTQIFKSIAEPPLKITLYQALIKKNLEIVFAAGTDIGIAKFVPIVSQYCQVRKMSENKKIRYQKIIRETTEQSGRGIMPQLENLISFDQAIQEQNGKSAYLFAPKQNQELKDFLPKIKKEKEISLFIGPEGGFSSQEIIFAEQQGINLCSLDNRIIRSEFAGIVASSAILYS